MTTEAILHDTLKYINRQTKNHAYINIIDTLWKDFPIEDQELLRRQLLDRDLISVNATNHLNATNQWEFQLTTKGILLIEQGEEKLKKDFLEFLIKESDVKSFMVNNFIKPDPKASSTTNETDSGVIFLKSLKRNGLIDYDDKALAHVNTWFIDNGNNPQIKRWFDTLHEPLYVNIVVQTDSIADYQNIEKSAETFGTKKNNNKEIIPGLLSDIESGDDLLDIMKDVSAFSRVIAAKSFEPPLAIALFGRWGSGKSFFMQKLRENITSLSLRPTDTYCKGVVHIHFNAWSYMDSNLWASIVSRIFEELNNYISENTISSEVKQEVEKQLTSKLSITREEIDILETKKLSIERQIESFNQRKEALSKSLNKNIDKIQKKTIGKIIEEVETEFKAKEKIEAALKENVEYIQSENELKEILPEKYWDNPSAAYSHIKSKSAFLKEFFKKNNFSNNLVWTIVLLVIILLAPVLISNISQKLVDANFTIPQIGISFLISVGAIWKRVEIIYDKIQPIAASVWKIKDEHDKEVRDAIAKFEQEEKALKLKIENDRAEINVIDKMIQQAESMKIDLEYRINNAIATETLYTFIERRSKSEDYKKHLGILSMIRKDFEILNDLIMGHKTELKLQNDAKVFNSKFTKPLERIVLYIDDLDRCPEENVVQVLEAVNLLMAYRLFIVVVGVDQRWVKNALVKKHFLQFSKRINEGGDVNDNLDKIEPSDYLEKIFQVPFHLKNASDTTVKQMIGKLAGHRLDLGVELASGAEQHINNPTNLPSTPNNNNIDTFDEAERESIPAINEPLLENIEALILTSKEIEMMQGLSKLIGNNPRAVKRFVNIYRIVKTYEGLTMDIRDQEIELLSIMFLIALSVGPLKNNYKFIVDHLNTYNNPSLSFNSPHSALGSWEPCLSDLLEGAAQEEDELMIKDLLNEHILYGDDAKLIKTIPLRLIHKYISFTDRFVFKNT